MIILHRPTIVTSEKAETGSIVIEDGVIKDVLYADAEDYDFRMSRLLAANPEAEVRDLAGKHVIAGGIDAHVHFREPGLTHKADISTESLAALAGGVTTVFDMPNTNPPTVTAEALRDKIAIAEEKSAVKTGFHIGATNSNAEMICKLVREGDAETGIRPEDIAGVKVFMGSSTGNMLVRH